MNGKYELQNELKNDAVTYRYGDNVLHLTKNGFWMISSAADAVSKDIGFANCPKGVEPFPGKTQEWEVNTGKKLGLEKSWQPGNVKLAY